MPWGTLKDQWERRTALKIAVRQTLSPQMSVRQTWTVDWFANMFANLSTAHDHWFSTARPLRLRPTPWGTRKVILRPPRISAVNCPQTARTVDVCVMWPGLKICAIVKGWKWQGSLTWHQREGTRTNQRSRNIYIAEKPMRQHAQSTTFGLFVEASLLTLTGWFHIHLFFIYLSFNRRPGSLHKVTLWTRFITLTTS